MGTPRQLGQERGGRSEERENNESGEARKGVKVEGSESREGNWSREGPEGREKKRVVNGDRTAMESKAAWDPDTGKQKMQRSGKSNEGEGEGKVSKEVKEAKIERVATEVREAKAC